MASPMPVPGYSLPWTRWKIRKSWPWSSGLIPMPLSSIQRRTPPAGAFRADLDPGPGAGSDELDRVVEQVGQALAQGGLVAQHRGQGRGDDDLRARRMQLRPLVDDAPDQRLDVDRGDLHGFMTEPGEGEQVKDHAVHPLGGGNRLL